MDVNVDEAVDFGQTMASSFRNILPNGFHGKISNQVKTMEQLKRNIKVGGKTVFDLEVSNLSNFGSVSNILGRLAAVSECMVSPSSLILIWHPLFMSTDLL